ncbi:MAG: hypothetical protein Q8L90_06165 [Bacteroidota bacterium]|nr:hypothetical protein [Bacteroidota bacterium]
MKSFYLLFLSAAILLMLNSCKKEAGEGGTSFIKGRVYAKYYNKNFTVLADSAYAPDIDIYIIYGDEFSYGERKRTSYNGTYEFKYLQKGTYKIFAYTRDSTGTYRNLVNQYANDLPVIQEVEITKNKQTVEVPDINIIQ